MSAYMNQVVLMSGAEYFDDSAAINPFMDKRVPIDRAKAISEHRSIKQALLIAGVEVKQVEAPADCQDGVYTANWALVRNGLAVMSNLPNARQGEEAPAEAALRTLGFKTIRMPSTTRFSGQGDALPCGNYLFAGTGYRTDEAAHDFIRDKLGYQVIGLQTKPLRTLCGLKNNNFGRAVTNQDSGWADSNFYDIDLALSILKPHTKTERGLIAWCPAAFTPKSRRLLHQFDAVDKIEVSLREAQKAFACNLVSSGRTVIMSAHAPNFKAAVERHDLQVVTPEISELAKGGGYIRCTTLTLDNA